ncbi:MAG: DUF2062 domain-containing protein [Candidatus Rokuibacteriota bacterium]
MILSWRRFREGVTHVLHLDEDPSRLAVGMAVGVFIGVTPFFFLHTLLALLVAFVFRLNKAATITGAWINLPWFAPFVYAFSLELGKAILSGDFSIVWRIGKLPGYAAALVQTNPVKHAGSFMELLWQAMFDASVPLFVGTTVVGAVLGVVTYVVTLEAVREIRRIRHSGRTFPQARDPAPPRGESRR